MGKLQRIAHYMYLFLQPAAVACCAFLMPYASIWITKPTQCFTYEMDQAPFKLGIENLSSNALTLFVDRNGSRMKIGLITNQTGKDQEGNRNIDILRKKGINVLTIFTPKHGYFARDPHGAASLATHDTPTQLPLVPWHEYDKNKSPCYAALQNIDCLIFDMQDSGLRYGYLTTLFQAMHAAQLYNKKVVVLDRPNLLGHSIEGALPACDTWQTSLQIPIPIRHGMTLGELAHYCNKYLLHEKVDLHVIPMENYRRTLSITTPLLAGNLSPNITNLAACYGYSLLGLFGEIAPFDVGLGTDQPFQCLALPESINFPAKKWLQVSSLLNNFGVKSQLHRYYSSRKKQHCTGLLVQISNINNVAAFSAFLTALAFFKNEGITLNPSKNFDHLIGTPSVTQFINGTLAHTLLETEINQGLQNFFHKAASLFLYTPLPKIIHL